MAACISDFGTLFSEFRTERILISTLGIFSLMKIMAMQFLLKYTVGTMPERTLQQYFHTYLVAVHRNILTCMFDTMESASQESFHQLRVNLKRFRFIGKTLINHGVKGVRGRIVPYRKIFRYAGKIRQQQVYTSLLNRHGVDQTDQVIAKHLKSKHEMLLQKWPRQVRLFLSEAVVSYPVIGRALLAWKITEDAYVEEMAGRIHERFAGDLPDDILHDSRKIVKALLYSCEVSRALRKAFDARFNLRTAVTLEDAIGDWHDLDLLRQKQYRRGALKKEKVRNHLNAEWTRERKKIDRLVPRLIRENK